MQFGILGSGSWATALAKILTDNNNKINWWIRNTGTITQILQRRHNPHYLSSAYFNTSLLTLQNNIAEVIDAADVLVIAIPSAFVESAFENLPADSFEGKKVISAIKGILPSCNQLLNDYMHDRFKVEIADYFTVLGLALSLFLSLVVTALMGTAKTFT